VCLIFQVLSTVCNKPKNRGIQPYSNVYNGMKIEGQLKLNMCLLEAICGSCTFKTKANRWVKCLLFSQIQLHSCYCYFYYKIIIIIVIIIRWWCLLLLLLLLLFMPPSRWVSWSCFVILNVSQTKSLGRGKCSISVTYLI